MAEPIIIHQEGFDVACGALEAEQRFDHSLAMLFVSLAYRIARKTSIKAHILKGDSFDTECPLRIDIEITKDILDYYLTAKVYSNYHDLDGNDQV